MSIQKFAISVPDAILADLKGRLGSVRWPDELDSAGWQFGSNLSYMRSLVDYWRDGFDWRRQEAALN
jgi:microsomal epoxide hydrolase